MLYLREFVTREERCLLGSMMASKMLRLVEKFLYADWFSIQPSDSWHCSSTHPCRSLPVGSSSKRGGWKEDFFSSSIRRPRLPRIRNPYGSQCFGELAALRHG